VSARAVDSVSRREGDVRGRAIIQRIVIARGEAVKEVLERVSIWGPSVFPASRERQRPEGSARAPCLDNGAPAWDNPWMMTRNDRQEALCRAYVQAIAALTGFTTSTPDKDYGVDMSLRAVTQTGTRHQDARVVLDLQLRSTTRANVSDREVRYDLDVRTYNFLRSPSRVPCLLIVLVLPDEEALWLSQSVEELTVRHCAYWICLEGMAPTAATSSVRIGIPRPQVFSVEAVRAIMQRLARGERP